MSLQMSQLSGPVDDGKQYDEQDAQLVLDKGTPRWATGASGRSTCNVHSATDNGNFMCCLDRAGRCIYMDHKCSVYTGQCTLCGVLLSWIAACKHLRVAIALLADSTSCAYQAEGWPLTGSPTTLRSRSA